MQTSQTIRHDCTYRPRHLLVLFACWIAVSGLQCSSMDSSSVTDQNFDLEAVDRFAVYFADSWQEELTAYDMAVVDPDAYGQAEVKRLATAGTLPIGYVNIGEVEAYRSHFSQVDSSWILGANPNWEDHYYIDARKEGWQTLLLDDVIPKIMDKGYKGLFLDMVDTALPGLYPETRSGMAELVMRIREAFPDALLIMNNGFFLAEEVGQSLDGITAEGVLTRYNFETDTYERTPEQEQQPTIRTLRGFQNTFGLQVFLLDYAGAEDADLRAYARQRARQLDLRSFISTVELDTVPEPTAKEP